MTNIADIQDALKTIVEELVTMYPDMSFSLAFILDGSALTYRHVATTKKFKNLGKLELVDDMTYEERLKTLVTFCKDIASIGLHGENSDSIAHSVVSDVLRKYPEIKIDENGKFYYTLYN